MLLLNYNFTNYAFSFLFAPAEKESVVNEEDDEEPIELASASDKIDNVSTITDSQMPQQNNKGKYFVDFKVKLAEQSLSSFGLRDQKWFCNEMAQKFNILASAIEIRGLVAGSVIINARAWFNSQNEADDAAVKLKRDPSILAGVENKYGVSFLSEDPTVASGSVPEDDGSIVSERDADRIEEEQERMLAADKDKEKVRFSDIPQGQLPSTESMKRDAASYSLRGSAHPAIPAAPTAQPRPPQQPPSVTKNITTISEHEVKANNETSAKKKTDKMKAVPPPSNQKLPSEDRSPIKSEASPPAMAVGPTPKSTVEFPSYADESKRGTLKKTASQQHLGDISTREQRMKRQWADTVPSTAEALELERLLAQRRAELAETEKRLRLAQLEEQEVRVARLQQEQEARKKKYEEEDQLMLAALEEELQQRRKERLAAERQRRLEVQELEKSFVKAGELPEYKPPAGAPGIVEELPPLEYNAPNSLPSVLLEKHDTVSMLDTMLRDQANAKRRGGNMSMEDYERMKQQMALRQMERDEKLRHVTASEQESLYSSCSRDLQRVARGFISRRRAKKLRAIRDLERKRGRSVIKIQALARGYIAKIKTRVARRLYLENLFRGKSSVLIQKMWRGYKARKIYRKMKRLVCVRDIQRVFRGHLGRLTATRERDRLKLLRKKQQAAAVIQSAWRMKVAREEYRSIRIHILAAIEIQRIYRGHLGKKQFIRRQKWAAATPGPERIKLGLKLIEESKVAFERQQEEIDALHRAQERAEARVSHIHADLKESEKELLVLEKELQEIDHIERDLQTLTHERDILTKGITEAAGMPRTIGASNASLAEMDRRKKAEAYALEMTIQIKRAEREKKRQELETEFAAVFKEVEKKKLALEKLELALTDMEATRERKDREFRRLQRNLMQLLMEQKHELDDLREKGIELETATATTAAAATATAMKAKEHEKRSTAMFSQTEELMKFQFMSMSLSYFSSLNMLKQLRDMNIDTTSAAVTSSADAAAAAAAAATAANLPKMRKLGLGAGDFVELGIQSKRAELAVR